MRIAFILFNLEGGGAERMVSRLANAFVNKDIKVDIILLFTANNIAYAIDDRIHIFDFSFPLISWKMRIKVKQIFKIREYILEYNPDIIFSFIITTVPYAVLANMGLSNHCKIIGSQRANPKSIKCYHRILTMPFLYICNGIVFQTKRVMDKYPVYLRKKSVVIGNIAPKVQGENKQNTIENAICSIGRLHTDKDFKTLIEAFAIVLKFVERASLHIYGQGPLEDDLKALANHLGISNNIFFEGFSNNVIEELKQYDIFAFSSKAEGMPNALMEAMAAGLACVATDCEYGPAELIEDGVNGYLVAVGDAEQMAKRLVYLLQNEKKRKEIQREARKISDTFSEEKIVNAYCDYARKICGKTK